MRAKNKSASIKTIDAYLRKFPEPTRKLLKQMRAVIKRAAPGSVETIKYGIPTFVLGKNLVHFGGFRSHIGFYPTSKPIAVFKKRLARYETSRGTVKFPITEKLPLTLIREMVKFRVRQLIG